VIFAATRSKIKLVRFQQNLLRVRKIAVAAIKMEDKNTFYSVSQIKHQAIYSRIRQQFTYFQDGGGGDLGKWP
jgi:hypothetical protein